MDLRGYLKLLGIYALLVIVQVLVFNNIKISSYGITPFFYVLFVLSVPFEVPKWLTLCFAFVLGYTIDMFADTPGLHTAASVFMAFMRPVMLNILAPRDGYESGLFPYAAYMGMPWYLRYSVPLIFLHHISYFLIDSIGFFSIFQILIKILCTTAVTVLFVVLSQFFVRRR